MTVKTRPWTLTLPARADELALAATFTVTVFVPVPMPLLTLNHVWAGAAVHEQVPSALTVKLTLPPSAGALAEPGERL